MQFIQSPTLPYTYVYTYRKAKNKNSFVSSMIKKPVIFGHISIFFGSLPLNPLENKTTLADKLDIKDQRRRKKKNWGRVHVSCSLQAKP